VQNEINLDFATDTTTVTAEADAYAAQFGCTAEVVLLRGPTGWPVVAFVGGWAERASHSLPSRKRQRGGRTVAFITLMAPVDLPVTPGPSNYARALVIGVIVILILIAIFRGKS
jgi:hypothetical protein